MFCWARITTRPQTKSDPNDPGLFAKLPYRQDPFIEKP